MTQLHGKVAVVTGSTSGIGLGIARALGGAGAHLVLNGFGDAPAIAALRERLAGEFKVRVRYDGADLAKPAEVRALLVQKQIDDLARSEKLAPEEAKRRLLAEKQPSGEFATPEQIGELALFLCSDAAAQIRGAALSIDGAWTAQ